jgi:CheY-like chemotaxis protein
VNLVSEALQEREAKAMVTTTGTASQSVDKPAAQQVVVVGKQSQLNGLLETVLDAGQYDVVFVESADRAYSHIKRLAPHLVIVCLDIDDIDGFHVLSMLKLDAGTRNIPVVTWTVASDSDNERSQSVDPADDDVFGDQPATYMN